MEKYIRNILVTGLAAIALFATAGCQTLKIEPIYYPDNRELYIDNNTLEHAARVESLEGRNNPVYLKLINKTF